VSEIPEKKEAPKAEAGAAGMGDEF